MPGTTRALSDRSGQPIHIGRRLGGGGEGDVYEVSGRSGVAAKIYHKHVAVAKEEKVKAMLSHPSAGIRDYCAWPTDLLLEGALFRGFLMPLVKNHKELHLLHGPKSRQAEFPDVGFDFLVCVAANVARAMANLHASAIVIGDVNERGILVGSDGLVRFIDCDSFQVKTPRGTFCCDVGVSSFTPPELQGKNLGGIQRTIEHDAFGLAVLVFLLIFMGRHPFTGRYAHGDIELEEAIKQCRYAYSWETARTEMSAPPGALRIESGAGGEIAAMFERSFSPGALSGQSRPSADDWVRALRQLQKTLTSCNYNRAHSYARGQPSCPWCALEKRTGIDLFTFIPGDKVQAAKVDVEAIFQALGALKIPAVPKPKTSPTLASQPLPGPLVEKMTRYKDLERESRRVRDVVNASVERIKAADSEVIKIQAALVNANPKLRRLKELKDGAIPQISPGIMFAGVSAMLGASDALSAMLGSKFTSAEVFFGLLLLFCAYFFLRWKHFARCRRLAEARFTVLFQAAVEAEPSIRTQLQAYASAAAEAHREEEQNLKLADAMNSGMLALREEMQRDVDRLKGELIQKRSACSKEADAAKEALASVEARGRALEKDLGSRQAQAVHLIKQYRDIEDRRRANVQKLKDDEREQQLQAFLDRMFIDQANIQGITLSLKAALKSYGVETAADVTESAVDAVPGFGPVRTKRMLDWRKHCERSYTPGMAINPAKVAAIDSKCLAERSRIERDLQASLDNAQSSVAQLSSAIGPAKLRADRAVDSLAQAQADLGVLAQVPK